jgi:ubiquitin
MQKFREDVGSDMSKPTDRLIKTILNNPEEIKRQFQDYVKKAFESRNSST